MSRRVHVVFHGETLEIRGEVPYVADDPKGNHGLPDWFFGYDAATDSYSEGQPPWANAVVDLDTGLAEYVPPMGPAPIWKLEGGGLLPREEMLSLLREWWLENFG